MPNVLAQERSAYLRQHQANPVDWLPWGEAALKRAREFNKPILLSIGYSACHWCHVMARESFDDAGTAALMNDWFVNVKVDREERPDIDAIYIRALQAMGRRPGWPLTMFLTPDAKPFWGGTYFPSEERDGLPAFREVLKYVHEAYRSAPDANERKGQELVAELIKTGRSSRKALTSDAVTRIAEDLLANVDPNHGGLVGAPKFPYPALFRFLWNQGVRSTRADFQGAVVLTLDKIALGGLFDHVGGGFFRYAVDARWGIPHFEKMLYDNALLIALYSEVYRIHQKPIYREVVRRTVAWLLREMLVPNGGFACSLDAESDGKEGGYYCLTGNDVAHALGPAADAFRRRYFDSSTDFDGAKILNRSKEPSIHAEQADFIVQCDRLLAERGRRKPPHRDDKIVADWNGLAVAALADASIVFDEPAWRAAAENAFQFVANNMSSGGVIHHAWNDAPIGTASILDDYANMAHAGLKLFEITGNSRFRDLAIGWTDYCIAHFADPQGGFFYTPDTAQLLVARIRDGQDTVTPSGNGVMARVLSQLYYTTGEERYAKYAQSLFDVFAGEFESGSFLLASVLDAHQFKALAVQVTVVGERKDSRTKALWGIAQHSAPPDRAIVIVDTNEKLPAHHPAAGKIAPRREPIAFVCLGTTCSMPLSNPDKLEQALEGAHGPRSH